MRIFLGLLFVAGGVWISVFIAYGLRTGQYYGTLWGLWAMVLAVAFWWRAVEYDMRSGS